MPKDAIKIDMRKMDFEILVFQRSEIRVKSRFWTTGRRLLKKLYQVYLFAPCLRKGMPNHRLGCDWLKNNKTACIHTPSFRVYSFVWIPKRE